MLEKGSIEMDKMVITLSVCHFQIYIRIQFM